MPRIFLARAGELKHFLDVYQVFRTSIGKTFFRFEIVIAIWQTQARRTDIRDHVLWSMDVWAASEGEWNLNIALLATR